MRYAVRDWTDRYDEPFVMYFHVWELDPKQPRINAASNYNRIRHYRKLDKMEWIIRENLQKYDFTSAANFLGLKNEIAVRSPESEIKSPSAEIRQSSVCTQQIPVTIVIPCYNEESALSYLANTLRSVEVNLTENGYQPKFIFVDDCSADQTFDKLDELFGARENVKILRHKSNQGVAGELLPASKIPKRKLFARWIATALMTRTNSSI